MRPHLFSRLALDERGTSLIEFGFLAPFLALLTMGVIDLSRGIAERFELQQAVSRSLELVQARPAVAGADEDEVNYDFVVEEAMDAADVEEDQVSLTRWLECDGVDKGDVNGKCEAGQDTARYLRVRIEKDFEGEFYFDKIPMAATGAIRTQ
ncbi:MAG TPA: TadE/TadG family type IV pilus assembly protein [Allosphingosinicella sp.]|jgi:Flp pilus assembly pilin Flp|nr:TadE/TadG family type IV pilus assembly protein [Allosphingosinicella sp.]